MEEIILTNLRIPSKGIMQFYANYTINNLPQEAIIRNEPARDRQVHVNCPPNSTIFMHMKICLLGLNYENTEENNILMDRVLKSQEENIQFGKFVLSDIGNCTAIVNNVKNIIYLKKI
jgi:hypothetical protein